jgi:thiopurine S-methyltransferase
MPPARPSLSAPAATPLTGRDNACWRDCWRDRRTDFHQTAVNPLLVRCWPMLGLAAGSRVLVPLCGKSLDMLWLAAQGHAVVGVELSPIAVGAFFRENGLKPRRRQAGAFTLWEHGRLAIFCGDYFALQPKDLGRIDAVYDRAALTALAEDIRVPYVARLRELVPADCELLLLTTEDAEEGETLAQSQAAAPEIERLYAREFAGGLILAESAFETDPEAPLLSPVRVELKAYRLAPREKADSSAAVA